MAAACGDDDQERADTHVTDSGDDLTTETTEASEGDEDDPGALLLVMDSSGSMNSRADGGERLIDLAKSALGDVVEELPDDQHVGLRVYGHRYPNTDRENGCADTELIHPMGPLDRPALLDSIDSYDAQGFTPIGLSLREAARDLPPEGERTIVLVSDGQETCDTDPCQVAEDLAAEGVDLVVHTVGFVLDLAAPDEADQARSELSCVAEATGGSFVDVEDAEDLAGALEDMSVRDPREVEMTGAELEGALVPRDAPTGEVDTWYTDTVLDTEKNFYRFEVTPGSQVQAEVVMTGNEDGGCDSNGGITLLGPALWLVTAGDTLDVGVDGQEAHHRADSTDGSAPLNTTLLAGPVPIASDEVFVKVTPNDPVAAGCSGQAQFEIEFRVTEQD